MISKHTMTFHIGHKSNNNAELSFFILSSKSNDEKLRKGEKKRDNRKHRRDKREVVRKKNRILEVNVF